MKIINAPPPQVSAKDGPMYGAGHPQSISWRLTDGPMVKEVYIRDDDVECVRWGVPYDDSGNGSDKVVFAGAYDEQAILVWFERMMNREKLWFS